MQRLIALLAAGTVIAAGTALAAGQPGDGPGRRAGKVMPTTLAEAQDIAGKTFDRQDANKDGYLTRDELGARAKRGGNGERGGARHGNGEGLGRADTNGDGVITREEMLSPALARFDKMDTNGDGVLSEDERRKKGAEGRDVSPTRANVETMIDRRFTELDANGDGRIDAAEQAAAKEERDDQRADRKARMETAIDARFDAMDTDRDDRVSRAEALAAAVSRFNTVDTDGNGTLSETEKSAARDAMRARYQGQ